MSSEEKYQVLVKIDVLNRRIAELARQIDDLTEQVAHHNDVRGNLMVQRRVARQRLHELEQPDE
jgi:regulator of replication initiation timing